MKKSLLYYLTLCIILLYACQNVNTKQVYVSTTGQDTNKGTQSAPFRTLERAKEEIEKQEVSSVDTVEIIISEGTYYLETPLVFDGEKYNNTHYVIRAKDGEKVVISGGRPLENLSWEEVDDNIWKTSVEDIDSIPSLYSDEGKLIPARYPNYKEGVYPYGGYSKDALSSKRIATWSNPEGGYIHAMHQGKWGGMHYRITGKVGNDSLRYEGGRQNNRPSAMHPELRFVDHIFEELDAPKEWFYNKSENILYYYPEDYDDLNNMTFVAGRLESLIQLKGTEEKPVRNIEIKGLTFSHTVPTFMKTKEPLMRSDWRIYRNGAILLEGTDNVTIRDNDFTLLDGNAIFVSGYNRATKIEGNLIEKVGANAIALVGSADAVRSPSFQYKESVPEREMDTIAGPKTNDFPKESIVRDNLIRHIGEIEKQVAGVEIQMASKIEVSHNTIYHVPRAGINIGDGAWGGHVIKYNDVFETVLETSDHGAFNSWGRDRYWLPNYKSMQKLVERHPDWVLLDAVNPTIIRNNRFRCDHGWGIDLDDGSSNYKIYNNIVLNGGIKLREGFYRTVTNNITLNDGIHMHLWFENSHDTIQNNLVMIPHQPIMMKYWGDKVDGNIFTSEKDLKKSQSQGKGVELNGVAIKPDFLDEKNGDYELNADSPILKHGFKNIDISDVGVQSKRLISIADKPNFPRLITDVGFELNTKKEQWHDALVKNIETLQEQSAAGLNKRQGVLILGVKEGTELQGAGLKEGDVIIACFGKPVEDLWTLRKIESTNRFKDELVLEIWRNQQSQEIQVPFQKE